MHNRLKLSCHENNRKNLLEYMYVSFVSWLKRGLSLFYMITCLSIYVHVCDCELAEKQAKVLSKTYKDELRKTCSQQSHERNLRTLEKEIGLEERRNKGDIEIFFFQYQGIDFISNIEGKYALWLNIYVHLPKRCHCKYH